MNKRNNGYFQEEPKKSIEKPSLDKPPTKRETVYPKEVSYRPFLLSKVNPFSQQDARKATGEDISDRLEELARKSEWGEVFGLIGQLRNNGQLIALDELKTAIWRVADIAKARTELDYTIRLLGILLELEEEAPSPVEKRKGLQEMQIIDRIIEEPLPNFTEIARRVKVEEHKVWEMFKAIKNTIKMLNKKGRMSIAEIENESTLEKHLARFALRKLIQSGIVRTAQQADKK